MTNLTQFSHDIIPLSKFLSILILQYIHSFFSFFMNVLTPKKWLSDQDLECALSSQKT